MGRREVRIDPDDDRPEARFARALRELRLAAGSPTYRELERAVGYSDTALSAALSGRTRPSLDVVEALVPALGGDATVWRALWIAHFGPATAPAVDEIAAGAQAPPHDAAAPGRDVGPVDEAVTGMETEDGSVPGVQDDRAAADRADDALPPAGQPPPHA